MYKVTLFEGDGIGPEITKSVQEIISATGVNIEWHPFLLGQRALESKGSLIPEDAVLSLKTDKIALKGPITTPVGKGFRSINVSLRLLFDLYINLRPSETFPNTLSRYNNIDLVTVRENTEDLYVGIEHEIEDGFEALKIITRKASERIIRFAFEYAKTNNRKKVTCVHKANILKQTDGLFLSIFNEISKEYENIEGNSCIIDNMCMQLVMYPERYDVIVAPNLYGDILSDLIAGLVGGLGMVPSANIGKDIAIFEAVHGSAPDIAGQGMANPIALLLSAAMMLDYLGEKEAAKKIRKSVRVTLGKKIGLTKDLGGTGTTNSITKEIISNL